MIATYYPPLFIRRILCILAAKRKTGRDVKNGLQSGDENPILDRKQVACNQNCRKSALKTLLIIDVDGYDVECEVVNFA